MIGTRPVAILCHQYLKHLTGTLATEYIGVRTPVEIAIRLGLTEESILLYTRKMCIYGLLCSLKSLTIRWQDTTQIDNIKIIGNMRHCGLPARLPVR